MIREDDTYVIFDSKKWRAANSKVSLDVSRTLKCVRKSKPFLPQFMLIFNTEPEHIVICQSRHLKNASSLFLLYFLLLWYWCGWKRVRLWAVVDSRELASCDGWRNACMAWFLVYVLANIDRWKWILSLFL